MIRSHRKLLRNIRSKIRHRRGGTNKPKGARRLGSERLEQRRLLTGMEVGHSVPVALAVDAADYAADSLIVRFRDDVSPSQLHLGPNTSLFPFNADIRSPYRFLPSLREIGLPNDVNVESALELLQGHESILYAEPNYRIHVSAVPGDPRFEEMWSLNNEGQTGGMYDADIDAPEAWAETVGSGHTIVAVIDTGVDYLHEDLAANMWVNSGEIPGDGIDNDGNGFIDDIHGYDFANNDANPMDDQGHGTHVAGTIAAVGDNGVGVTGINWNAQIMALKFLDASGYGETADAIRAIDYAVANGATISNNSWGFEGSFSQALYDSIKSAQDADHVFVAAAGNGLLGFWGQDNDTTPFWPANVDLDNVISVAAVDHNDAKPLFSNYGATTVDLAAPGVDILSTTRNNGYGLNTGTSMATPHVTGVIALVRDLHPQWSYAQVLHQVLQTVDPISAMEGITVTGGRLNAAAAVGVEIAQAPDIQVLLGAEDLRDDVSTVDFGNTPPGLAQDLTFTVNNRGVLPLNLTSPITVPEGYSVVSSFERTTLDVGEATTFTLRLDGQLEGVYAGEVSFDNDDPDENPFSFAITGTVAVPPAVTIIDNGELAFETIGEWSQWFGQGYDGDVHESLAGTGQDVARWTFDRQMPGNYRVAVTWSSYTNRATNAPFTILDGNTALGTVHVNQQLDPEGLRDNGAAWQYLEGIYAIEGYTLNVELSDNANGRVNADAIRLERIDASPEIDVRLDGAEIVDGTSVIAFGTTTTGTSVQRTFTIRNLGGNDLLLDETVEVPPGFTLVAGLSAATLAPDQTATFSVVLNGDAAGSYSGEVVLLSNDADESPYNFTVEGLVEDPPAVRVIDNGDVSFTTIGAWTRWTGQGYENDIHEALAGTGADVASWSFTNLSPGYYRVAATWTAYTNRASNAPFELLVDGVTAELTTADQRFAPNDFAEANTNWEWLGGTHYVDSALVVQLNNAADGRVNADAIRLERLPQAPEITVTAGNQNLMDGSSVFDFGNTPPGLQISQVFIVENAGTEALLLQKPISVSSGFSLIAGFTTTTLQPGENTSFTVQFDAEGNGTATGVVSIHSNDADENPFNFELRGMVMVPPSVQIVDNGDAGFTSLGEWKQWFGQGYANDIHESMSGTGTDVATWTFAGLTPGLYRVAATWSHNSNRASNAPFSILDDADPLMTVYVNQRLAPSGFVDAGTEWQYLGGVHELASSTLSVRLNDLADGRLNADAMRIERLDPLPEIQVTQGASDLQDGVSTVQFGSTSLNTPLALAFDVTNRGGDVLHLNGPISLPAGYSLVSGFGQTELATDESTTFIVQLDAKTVGTIGGTIAFDSDDADESPFDFQVEGTVLAPPVVLINDNGDTGFSSVGEWRRWTGQGYLNDIHESKAGNGSDVVSWRFSNLLPGQYRVAATWTAFSNRASNSPFTILDDATPLATVRVNQRVAPQELPDAGVYWDALGTTFQIDSGTLVVQLSDDADGRVNADAIRIERLEGGVNSTTPGAATGGNGLVKDVLILSSARSCNGSIDPDHPFAAGIALESQSNLANLRVGSEGYQTARRTTSQHLRDRLFSDWPVRLMEVTQLLDDPGIAMDYWQSGEENQAFE